MSSHNHTLCLLEQPRKIVVKLRFLLLLAAVAALIAVHPKPSSLSVAAVAAQESDQITFSVDESIRPIQKEMPGLDRESPPRPLSALIGPKGHQVEFVQNELTLVTDDAALVESFVERWGGTLIKSVNPRNFRLTGVSQHLVRIDPNRADEASFLFDLKKK